RRPAGAGARRDGAARAGELVAAGAARPGPAAHRRARRRRARRGGRTGARTEPRLTGGVITMGGHAPVRLIGTCRLSYACSGPSAPRWGERPPTSAVPG